MTTAERIVQAQLDAYNAKDLQTFIACYAEDVKVYRFPSMTLSMAGRAEMAERYANNRFNLAHLHAELTARMVHGCRVIDHEYVTATGREPVRAVAIYDVNDNGLIQTVWFVDED